MSCHSHTHTNTLSHSYTHTHTIQQVIINCTINSLTILHHILFSCSSICQSLCTVSEPPRAYTPTQFSNVCPRVSYQYLPIGLAIVNIIMPGIVRCHNQLSRSLMYRGGHLDLAKNVFIKRTFYCSHIVRTHTNFSALQSEFAVALYRRCCIVATMSVDDDDEEERVSSGDSNGNNNNI